MILYVSDNIRGRVKLCQAQQVTGLDQSIRHSAWTNCPSYHALSRLPFEAHLFTTHRGLQYLGQHLNHIYDPS
jgi:uncharacterized damage-inducible protein DinB